MHSEALAKLRDAKELLGLGMCTQAEYDAVVVRYREHARAALM